MPQPPEPRQRFELIVPASPGHGATVRLFAATVGRALGADEDAVEDLKLAVSEIATAVVVNRRSDEVRVVAVGESGRLTVAVGPVEPGDLTDDGSVDPADIVLALFPDATRDEATSSILVPFDLGIDE
jgi:hypothetical protein